MAPGGVEPPHADSKSAALSAELRGPVRKYARGLVRIRGAPARIRGSPVEAERQALGPRAKILSAVPALEITAALPPTASLPRIFVSPLTASVALLPSLR